MKDYYITKEPIYYAVGALAIILFTSLVFLLYDLFVERRQRLVMKTATTADKVVSSLFPEHVKARLYEKDKLANAAGQRDFMSLKKPKMVDAWDKVDPIATIYPETTVLFAGEFFNK